MNMKRFIAIVFLSAFISVSLFAQSTEMTPYEKARKDLADNTLMKIFDSMSERDQLAFGASFLEAISQTDDIFEQTAIAENFIYDLCGVGETFKTEANYLAASIFASRAYAGNLLQELKSIGDWYTGQRSELDKTRTSGDIAREKERAKLSAGIGRARSAISKAFSEWAQKGEYEKTAAYEARLKADAKDALDSICFTQMNAYWKKDAQLTKGKYNADSDRQTLVMTYKNADGDLAAQYTGSFPFTAEYSKQIGNSSFAVDESYATAFMLDNGRAVPAAIHLVVFVDDYYTRRSYIAQFGEAEHLTFKIDDFPGIPDKAKEILAGYEFDYSEYVKSGVPKATLLDAIYSIRVKYEVAYPNISGVSYYIERSDEGRLINYSDNPFVQEKQYFLPKAAYKKAIKAYDNYCAASIYQRAFMNEPVADIISFDADNQYFHADNARETDKYIYECLCAYASNVAKSITEAEFYPYPSAPKMMKPLRSQSNSEPVSQFCSFISNLSYLFPEAVTEANKNEIALALINSNPDILKTYNKWLKSSEYKNKLKTQKQYADIDPTYHRLADTPAAYFVFYY